MAVALAIDRWTELHDDSWAPLEVLRGTQAGRRLGTEGTVASTAGRRHTNNSIVRISSSCEHIGVIGFADRMHDWSRPRTGATSVMARSYGSSAFEPQVLPDRRVGVPVMICRTARGEMR